MTATTAISYSASASLAPAKAQRACPEGLDRAMVRVGISMAEWAQNHADRKAAVRRSSALSGLSDRERAQLYQEGTRLRDSAYADRARWHVIG